MPRRVTGVIAGAVLSCWLAAGAAEAAELVETDSQTADDGTPNGVVANCFRESVQVVFVNVGGASAETGVQAVAIVDDVNEFCGTQSAFAEAAARAVAEVSPTGQEQPGDSVQACVGARWFFQPTTEGNASASVARGAFANLAAPASLRVRSLTGATRSLVALPSDAAVDFACANELTLAVGDEITLDSQVRTDSTLSGVGVAVSDGSLIWSVSLGECGESLADRPACFTRPAPALGRVGILLLLLALLALGCASVMVRRAPAR